MDTTYSFDVAWIPAGIEDRSAEPRWSRVTVADEGLGFWAAHLAANQMAGRHGMVTEVLVRI